jgi:hypothetical protein
MISQTDQNKEMRRLTQRREELRFKLKEHFCTPVTKRNYKEFEVVVDELDDLRRRIRALREECMGLS